ncbi:hypothetical protein FACS189449_10940 [Alphaproteobacteria bacterium]|nr:hypothetical protein FACS189449_10940 [Alphaproteobacteria bacterium]
MKTSKAIDVCAITIGLLILGGCNSTKIEHKLGYNFETFDISDDELVGHTFVELENKQYTKQYAEKKIELKKAYDEFVKHSGMDAVDQQKEFERFIESYADKQPCLGCRAGSYHYYGHMIDMIDLRIKHLKIYTAWYSRDTSK